MPIGSPFRGGDAFSIAIVAIVTFIAASTTDMSACRPEVLVSGPAAAGRRARRLLTALRRAERDKTKPASIGILRREMLGGNGG
jgi:hypothetical protein